MHSFVVIVAERLRRLTRNQLGSARAGSSPADDVLPHENNNCSPCADAQNPALLITMLQCLQCRLPTANTALEPSCVSGIPHDLALHAHDLAPHAHCAEVQWQHGIRTPWPAPVRFLRSPRWYLGLGTSIHLSSILVAPPVSWMERSSLLVALFEAKPGGKA